MGNEQSIPEQVDTVEQANQIINEINNALISAGQPPQYTPINPEDAIINGKPFGTSEIGTDFAIASPEHARNFGYFIGYLMAYPADHHYNIGDIKYAITHSDLFSKYHDEVFLLEVGRGVLDITANRFGAIIGLSVAIFFASVLTVLTFGASSFFAIELILNGASYTASFVATGIASGVALLISGGGLAGASIAVQNNLYETSNILNLMNSFQAEDTLFKAIVIIYNGFITSIGLENKRLSNDIRFDILTNLNESYKYFLYQDYFSASYFLIQVNQQFSQAQNSGVSFVSTADPNLDINKIIEVIGTLVDTYTIDISKGVEGTALAVLGGTMDQGDNYQFDLQKFVNIITRYAFQKRYFTQADLDALYV